MWECCILSKLDMEEAKEEIDEVENMRIEDFKKFEMFCSIDKTYPVSENKFILDVFRLFKGRDMILEANTMAEINQNNGEMLKEKKQQDETELLDRMVEDN